MKRLNYRRKCRWNRSNKMQITDKTSANKSRKYFKVTFWCDEESTFIHSYSTNGRNQKGTVIDCIHEVVSNYFVKEENDWKVSPTVYSNAHCEVCVTTTWRQFKTHNVYINWSIWAGRFTALQLCRWTGGIEHDNNRMYFANLDRTRACIWAVIMRLIHDPWVNGKPGMA